MSRKKQSKVIYCNTNWKGCLFTEKYTFLLLKHERSEEKAVDKINFSTAVRNLKKNFLLLFSTVAALCLFLSPSITSLAMTGGMFIAVCVAASYDLVKPKKAEWQYAMVGAVLIAVLISFVGYDTFYTTWTTSSKVAALTNALGVTMPILLTAVGLLGCIVGFYSFWVLGQWITNISYSLLKEKLPEQRKDVLIVNLKRNWIFPISAMTFFCLNAALTKGYLIAMVIAFAISIVIASQIPSIFDLSKKGDLITKIIAILSAFGICWACQHASYTDWSVSSKLQAIEAMLPFTVDIPAIISIFGAIAALGFVYLYVLLFLLEVKNIITDTKIASGFRFGEIVIYSLLLVGTLALMVSSFSASQAFYDTDVYDIIYTSDSPALVKGNVYMALTHPENDLRQPLFAVFAAPFMGIPYLIGQVFSATAPVQAMLLNSVQILMLFAANFMLSKIMKLTSVNRICFIVLSSLTYTHLLFVLMMEQYIVAYFWLIFCVYSIHEKKQPSRIALWGAGGTLLTSMILLPAMSEKSPFKNFKEWIGDMVKYGLEFVAVMLVFCRFDVIFYLTAKISQLSNFTGKSIALADKICQYTAFVCDCFVAPDAGINHTAEAHISWQLNQVTEINFVGILILVLCLISAWSNRSKKSSMFAVGWVGFSVIMLLGLGWGTKENGLILYALYFGWAFMVLLFQLVERIGEKLNLRFLVPVATVVCAVLFAVINIPSIAEMIQFAIQYYPV